MGSDDAAIRFKFIRLPVVLDDKQYVIDTIVIDVMMTSRQIALVKDAHVAVDAR